MPSPIDTYLSKIEPTKREQLERIRRLAKKIVPQSEEVISYGMPTLKFMGKPYLGFDLHKNHIGIYPYSNQVIDMLKDKLHGYSMSKGAIRIPLDAPIPDETLTVVINCRLDLIRALQNQK